MENQPENQFDFWLGEWDVTWGEDGKGTNHIERILGGKIIQENFRAPDLQGLSVSSYDTERKLWCQTWVDSNGTYLDFTGNFEDGKMILRRDAIVRGEACQQRMVWYDIQADKFTWNWERSDDLGETWRVLWQINYRRRV
ncbi:MAG TPA: hypothetical protein VK880_11845 [Anaerolineales bacterium]|nr:hypothetical protein [Anaerolineales bacterium]